MLSATPKEEDDPKSSLSSLNIAIYPALLSHISRGFITNIQTGVHSKDSLEYTDCFQGKHAVVSRLSNIERALSLLEQFSSCLDILFKSRGFVLMPLKGYNLQSRQD